MHPRITSSVMFINPYVHACMHPYPYVHVHVHEGSEGYRYIEKKKLNGSFVAIDSNAVVRKTLASFKLIYNSFEIMF